MRSILLIIPAVIEDAATLPTTTPNDRRVSSSTDKSDVLWRDFFKNPSHWGDVRSIKTDPRSPDFKHKTTEDPLWIFGWLNPCWVQEELRRRGLLKRPNRSGNGKDGEFPIELGVSASSTNDPASRQRQDGENSADNLPSTTEEEQLEGSFTTGVVNLVPRKIEEDTRACIAFVAALKACADRGDLLGGISLHADIARHGLLQSNQIIGGAVVNMYAKCGALLKAQEVFDVLPARSVASWNALIAGYAQNERGQKALVCFERMQSEGIFPDAITIVCVLNACGNVGAVDKGQEMHAYIVKEGLLDLNIVVGNALVDMYACCQLLPKAQAVFLELHVRNEISWTTMITGFVQHGQGKEALDCFEMMKLEGLVMTMATSLCILKACAINGAVYKGQELHAALIKDGLLINNMVVGTALVDMYAKCGALGEAQKIFDELPMQDVISWGALLDGYAQHTDGEEAIRCFEEMQQGGFSPDGATFICVLQASGSIGAIHKGLEVHAEIAREGWFEKDAAVINSLVDMYAKCGMLVEAHDVFDELLVRNVITWNALIAGYAQLGEEAIVSSLINEMVSKGTEPDSVTFLILFNACSHRGLLSSGQTQFERMIAEYSVDPSLEHLTCMVDLYGRTGQIHKALAVIKVMPVRADMSTMLSVLSACYKSGNMQVGSWALAHTLQLNREHSSAYVSISNMYAIFGNQEDIEETETLSEQEQLGKDPGHCWWVD